MLGKRKHTVGLYIGAQKTVLARLQKVGSSNAIIDHLGVVDTPSDAFGEDGIVNVPSVSKVIRDLLDEIGVKAQEVTLTIPTREGVIIRSLTLPSMSKKEMREALKGEVENYAPLSSDEPVLDFHVVGQTFDGTMQKNEILLVAATKSLIRSYVAAIEATNMKLSVVEPLTISILRTITPAYDVEDENEQPVPSNNPVMVVCLEENDGTVSIAKGQFIRFIHSIEFGRAQLEDARAFGELANELRSSLTYYQATYPDQTVEKVIFFADGNESENICVRLSEFLDIPVVGPPLPETADEFTRSALISNSLSAFAAIGTALYAKGEGSINLIPTRSMGMIPDLRQQALVSGLVAGLTVFLAISSTFALKAVTGSIHQKTTDTIRARESVSEGVALGSVESEVARLRTQIQLAKATLNAITTVQWADVLPELRMIIPKTVWLNNLSWQENNSVILSGSALSYDSVFRFVDTLKASPYFTNPQITFVRKTPINNTAIMQFEIKFGVLNEKLGGQEVNLGIS
jgi:type IV pilus assembly protein PilM